ncbi:hypothetical protein ACC676_39170, partial [Rhizobium ruizarguesonis]
SADFSNPTGETVDLDGRKKFLALAEDLYIAVIEDAAYQSLRYDGDPIPPILALEIAEIGRPCHECGVIRRQEELAEIIETLL